MSQASTLPGDRKNAAAFLLERRIGEVTESAAGPSLHPLPQTPLRNTWSTSWHAPMVW